MPEILPQLGLIFLLIIVNAAFAGTELAPVSYRGRHLQRLENRSATAATRAQLARQPIQFLTTIQIGTTLAGFLTFTPNATTPDDNGRTG